MMVNTEADKRCIAVICVEWDWELVAFIVYKFVYKLFIF